MPEDIASIAKNSKSIGTDTMETLDRVVFDASLKPEEEDSRINDFLFKLDMYESHLKNKESLSNYIRDDKVRNILPGKLVEVGERYISGEVDSDQIKNSIYVAKVTAERIASNKHDYLRIKV